VSAPRLEIDLTKLQHNTGYLVEKLSTSGISVTGVTKAFLASPEIAKTLIESGVSALGDSRIENIEKMRHAGIVASMTLIRSPMMSQVARVVRYADISFNTEIDIIRNLSNCASKAGVTHGIVLMVEMGDLREGIMLGDIIETVYDVLSLPNIKLCGIGTNLACRSGVSPDERNMAELSDLADAIDARFGITLDTVSGGNSGNIEWALSGVNTGRINELRLGEALLLGREPLQRQAIDDLHTDAFTLVAEVIESKIKPSRPWGKLEQNAFGEQSSLSEDDFDIAQTILAIGLQDTDLTGLRAPTGIEIIGGSSDHLIVNSGSRLPIGCEIRFQPNYSALVRAMTSPFVEKVVYSHDLNVEHGKPSDS